MRACTAAVPRHAAPAYPLSPLSPPVAIFLRHRLVGALTPSPLLPSFGSFDFAGWDRRLRRRRRALRWPLSEVARLRQTFRGSWQRSPSNKVCRSVSLTLLPMPPPPQPPPSLLLLRLHFTAADCRHLYFLRLCYPHFDSFSITIRSPFVRFPLDPFPLDPLFDAHSTPIRCPFDAHSMPPTADDDVEKAIAPRPR